MADDFRYIKVGDTHIVVSHIIGWEPDEYDPERTLVALSRAGLSLRVDCTPDRLVELIADTYSG